MEYVRHFDPEALRRDRFDYQVLAETETCVIAGCQAPGAGDGMGRHVHASDQIYFVLEGSMELELDGVEYHVEKNSIVFIPAGTPHSNHYVGPDRELHLDVIVPAPATYGVLSTPAAAQERGGPGTGYVRPVDRQDMREVLPGFRTLPLADRKTQSHHISFRLNEIDPGSDPLPWHIHEFDQFYFVLEGQMQLEVAHKKYTVRPGDLTILPAGVPHRNWNEGPSLERHLALLAPEAAPGKPGDMEVVFSLTDRHFG